MQPNVFSQYILRTPAFPIQNYLNLLENYTEETLLAQYKKPYVQEAISIASPELKKALDQWLANPLALNPEKRQGLAISLLKYMAQMSARCTKKPNCF
jgi:lantibiotic biosynthesis protein